MVLMNMYYHSEFTLGYDGRLDGVQRSAVALPGSDPGTMRTILEAPEVSWYVCLL